MPWRRGHHRRASRAAARAGSTSAMVARARLRALRTDTRAFSASSTKARPRPARPVAWASAASASASSRITRAAVARARAGSSGAGASSAGSVGKDVHLGPALEVEERAGGQEVEAGLREAGAPLALEQDLEEEANGTAPDVAAGEGAMSGRRWSGRRWSGRRWSGAGWSDDAE